jgi:hypothetical protein
MSVYDNEPTPMSIKVLAVIAGIVMWLGLVLTY